MDKLVNELEKLIDYIQAWYENNELLDLP